MPAEVQKLIEKVDLKDWSETSTFIDSSCGTGNILIGILNEKISRGHDPIVALSTIYGIDIFEDNVLACHKRLRQIVLPLCPDRIDEIDVILQKNIVVGNSLTDSYEDLFGQ